MKKILLFLFLILFSENNLNAQIDYSRGFGIIGNWGTMEGITELPDDYLQYLKRMNAQWVVIGNSLHVDNSVDSTVEFRYTNDYQNFVPSWSDATLRTMINQLHSNGFKVVLTQGIDEPWPEDGTPSPVLPAGSKPAWRYQIGDPKTPIGYTLSQWPWNPTNSINQKFVASFWNSYTNVSIYHAKLCQELGVELFEVGAESQELFRTSNIGTKYSVNYKSQIKAMVDSVRKYYTGKIAYYMHIGTWKEAITSTKADTMWHNLWGDAGFDVIGVSLYDAVKPTTANYTSTTTVNTIPYFKNLFITFLTKYIKPVLQRYPDKPIVALELGFQTRDNNNTGNLVEPEGLISADDFNKNNILDAEEIQSNLFDAYFQVSDSLGYPKGAMIFGDNADSDPTSALFANYNYWNIRDREAERRLMKRFRNISFTQSSNIAPKLLTTSDSDYVAIIGEKFESKKFDASDANTSSGDFTFYRTKWENYPWFGASSTHRKVIGTPQDDDFGWWGVKLFTQDIYSAPSVDTANFKLWVIHKRSSKVVSTPPSTMTPGVDPKYQIVVNDANGIPYDKNLLKYSMNVNPGFLSVSTSGLVKGIPTFQIAGTRSAVEIKITTPTNQILFDSWPLQVTNVNIAPLWENSRSIKIPGSTQTTFFIYPKYDTTYHKDSLITFRVVPASDYNSSDSLTYTYKIYDPMPSGTFSTTIVADKYNSADSIKYGKRETKCVAISNIANQLQVDKIYEVSCSVSDGKSIANIPIPYPRFRISGSTTPTPNINISTSQIGFGQIVVGAKSSSQNFDVSGTNLTGNITITPTAGFEIKTGTNEFTANAINLSQTSGNVNSTKIDIRFAPTLAQQYNSTIKISSQNALDKNITVTGTGTATAVPSLTISDSLIDFGNTNVGSVSQSKTFSVLGNNLSDTLKIISPTGFKIKTGTGNFSNNSIYLLPTNGQVNSTNIEVIFAPIIQADYVDTIKIISKNASNKFLIVKGVGLVTQNNSPKIISTAATQTIENSLYSYQVVATDPDTATGDKLKFEFEKNPTWLKITESGLVSGTPLRKNVGDTIFIVKVSDLQGVSVLQKTLLKIIYLNTPPTITSIADTIAIENELYSYQVTAKDSDSVFGDKLKFELSVAPTWLNMDETGLINGTPARKNVGDTIVIIKVSDLQGLSVLQKINLKIKYLNSAPRIISKADTVAFEDSTYKYIVKAEDDDIGFGDKIIYQLSVKPFWLSISNDGIVLGTPQRINIGDTTFTIKVTDFGGLSATQTIKLKVKAKGMGVKPYQSGVPDKFNLSQNFPNPFNPSTNIRFAIPYESKVKLEIYNSLGQLVSTLVDENLTANFYEVTWESKSNPSGLYFYKIISTDLSTQKNTFTQTRKMMFVK